MTSFDVGIIGGGPAGASLAISLKHQGLSVFVAERSEYQQWRAGETLSPKVSIPLSKLGMMNVLLETPHIASQAIRSAWGSSNLLETHSIMNPYGAGWLVGRSDFDSALIMEAENLGALVLRGANYVSAFRDDLWQINLRNSSGTLELRAKLIVDASGRVSQVARGLGAKAVFYDQLIAIVGILSPTVDEGAESILTIEATENGWCYMVPLPGGKVLAAFMTDRDIFLDSGTSSTSFWTKMIERSEHLPHLLEKFRLDDVIIKNASTFRLDKFAGPGWLAIGDAACAFDPLAGNGVLKALESGIDSSSAIQNGLDERNMFDNYAEKMALIFNNYLIGRRKYYEKEQRWGQSLFWRRRHNLP
jgi:flavin-dependent dehydrogenase